MRTSIVSLSTQDAPIILETMQEFDSYSYLLDKIKVRNTVESLSYKRIFQAYNDLLTQYNKTRALFLEYSIEKSRESVEKIEQLAVNKGSGEYTAEQYRALEDKLYSIQEELTNTLREKTQRAESLLQSRQALRELENVNRTLRENETVLHAKIEQLTQNLAFVNQEFKTAMETIELLKRQRTSLETDLESKRLEINSLQAENQQLLNSFLQLKQAQADEINSTNELHITIDNLHKEVKYLRDLLHKKEKKNGTSESNSISSVAQVPRKKHKVIKSEQEGNSLVFSKNNEFLAVGLFDKSVRIYNTSSYSEPLTLFGCTESVLRVAFSWDSQLVLGAFNDSVNIWSAQNGRLRHTLTGHTKKIYAADFSGDNSKVVTGSHDRSIKIWDASRGALIKTIAMTCKSTVNDLEISFPDNLIVTGHFDKIVRIHDLKTQKLITDLPQGHHEQVTSVNISKDNRYIVSMGRDSTIRVWDMRNFKQLNVYTASSFKNQLNWNKAVFSPDASYIVAGGADGKLYFWDVNQGGLSEMYPPLNGHDDIISSTSWKPNGLEIATCGRDKQIVIYK